MSASTRVQTRTGWRRRMLTSENNKYVIWGRCACHRGSHLYRAGDDGTLFQLCLLVSCDWPRSLSCSFVFYFLWPGASICKNKLGPRPCLICPHISALYLILTVPSQRSHNFCKQNLPPCRSIAWLVFLRNDFGLDSFFTMTSPPWSHLFISLSRHRHGHSENAEGVLGMALPCTAPNFWAKIRVRSY